MAVTPDDVLAAAQQMLADGLVEGTAGNISGRLEDGTVVAGERSPTTEKDLHLAALRRYPELGSVIHTHAVYATMFALAHEPIPAVIEEVVVYLGGDIPCCDYKGTGSRELGDEVASKLGDRGAALAVAAADVRDVRDHRRRHASPSSASTTRARVFGATSV